MYVPIDANIDSRHPPISSSAAPSNEGGSASPLRGNSHQSKRMAPTLCSRCGDAVDQGCDPRDELAELDALLERILIKRCDLKRKINRLHSPIVRQIPPDVTSTIFEFCLPNFADRQLLQEVPSFPLSLGAICSYWRDIAWSTPSLWSSLVVRVSSNHDPHIIAGVAQEWLARSGQLPLSIRISAFDNKTPLSALADIINQHSTRWSYLDLSMPPDCYQHFRAIDNHAPTLKSIRFHSQSDVAMSLKLPLLTCPRLERASLEKFPMNGSNIQWDNLTHLTLCYMSITDSFLILRKTPRLVFCKVTGIDMGYTRENIEALVLTSLRSLHLPICFADYFLDNIIAPHLEELSLLYYQEVMDAMASFLRRSACPLRSFSMEFPSFPPHFERFMKIFRSINTLSKISITETDDYPNPEDDHDLWNIFQFVANVLSSQSTHGFLPNLKILEYNGMLRLPAGNLDDLVYDLPPADDVHGSLHLFKLDLDPMARIPRNMMSYFSGLQASLQERGVTMNVLSNSEDILQSSIDYYRSKEEFSSKDWADDFESDLFLDLSQIE